jgi:Uma2 family endonuclease
MSVESRIITRQQFRQSIQQEAKRLELINGVVVEIPPSSKLNTIVAGLIIHYLNIFVLEHQLGYVTTPDGGYEIDDAHTFQPDAAFICHERLTSLGGVTFEAAPDLAVEVISPSESALRVQDRVRIYISGRTQMVWVVDPRRRIVDVWTPGTEDSLILRTLTAEATLDAGDILPGFSLPVVKILPKD